MTSYDQFSIKFPTPPFNPQFENVPLALDRWNFACLGLWHVAN